MRKNTNVNRFAAIVILFSTSVIPLAIANSSDPLPSYSGIAQTPIDLFSRYPENPVTSQIDEREIQAAINNTSMKGVLMRSLNALSMPPISSAIFGTKADNSGSVYCSSFDDPLCNDVKSLYYQISLTPCITSDQSDCISRFAAILPDGKTEEAKPVSPLLANKDMMKVSGESLRNIPSGGIPYVWTFPTLEHRGGKLFIPQVTLMNYGKAIDSSTRTKFAFDEPEFKIAINPVSPEVNPKYVFGAINQGVYSLLPDTFMDQSSFILEFRTSIPWRTWSRSTITDFELTSSKVGTNYLYNLKGKPSKVPVIAQIIPWTKNNISDLRAIDLGGVTVGQQCDNNSRNDPYQCWVGLDIGMGKANFDTFFKWFSAAEPFSDSRATLAPIRWNVESVPAFNQLYGSSIFGEGVEGAACVRDYGLASPMGVTSSNATLATDGPPTWDKSSASLNYKVAALHSLPNGEDFVGQYTLQIPKKLAECLWGKEASNAKAVVSIQNSDGTSQLVTSTTKVSNDYFKFYVAGFHFSSPKISISMKKQDPVKPISQPQVFTKITCIKGKISKVISGKAPSCPKGYKLKN